MSQLPTRCVPCGPGTPALSAERAGELLGAVPGWTLAFPRLERRFELEDFRAALAWVNRVGMLAEEEGHHPDFHLTGWKHVRLELWTHAVGGLTENDFVLAARIDELWARRS